MKREILINGAPRETRVAILEDDTLVELLVDRPDTRRTVGDIYLGKVEAVLPGIQAAFVDIGAEKSAFLHASDLVEPEEDELDEDEPNGRDDEDEADAAENAAAQGETNGSAEAGAEGGPKGPREFRRGQKLPPIQDLVKRGETLLASPGRSPLPHDSWCSCRMPPGSASRARSRAARSARGCARW